MSDGEHALHAPVDVNTVSMLGLDVGGRRKGFHACIVRGNRVVGGPLRCPTPLHVVELAKTHDVFLVGVDAPADAARPGEGSRDGERELAKAVCSIRYTPDEQTVMDGGDFYEWVRYGFEVRAALEAAGFACVEVFPTATATRLIGARGERPRARWTATAVAAMGLKGLASNMNQDERDCLLAAYSAREHVAGRSDVYGTIVVPRASATPQ